MRATSSWAASRCRTGKPGPLTSPNGWPGEDALEDDYAAIRYQGDYVRELIADTDYPSFDVDVRMTLSSSGRSTRSRNIMTFRDNAYKSVMTGTMAPVTTPPGRCMDDSMESYLRED